MSDFNPKTHLIKMGQRDYLETKWRLVWFREAHPRGGISTEVVSLDPLVIKATVVTEEGQILATGHAGALDKGNAVWSGRNVEKAETAAIGRALGAAGFGTQFSDDHSDGDHLAEGPVERRNGNGNGTSKSDRRNNSVARDWPAIFRAVEQYYPEDTGEERKAHWWNGTIRKFDRAKAITSGMTDQQIIAALTAWKSGRMWWENEAARRVVEADIGMSVVEGAKKLSHRASEYGTPALFVESVKGLAALEQATGKTQIERDQEQFEALGS